MFTQTPIKISIRSFGKYSLNAGSVPGIFLGTGDMLANETKSLLPLKTYILAGRGTTGGIQAINNKANNHSLSYAICIMVVVINAMNKYCMYF